LEPSLSDMKQSLSSSLQTRLEYQHQALFEILEGVADEQIRQHPVPGKWSVFEQIVHLTTYQHLFLHRVTDILNLHNPHFATYVADQDPLFLDYALKSSADIIRDLVATRRTLCAMFDNLDTMDWKRPGTHAKFGTLDLGGWLQAFLLHEAHHLYAIFLLVRTHGAPSPSNISSL
jgi:uncharacterized damage-inducible protein DinB